MGFDQIASRKGHRLCLPFVSQTVMQTSQEYVGGREWVEYRDRQTDRQTMEEPYRQKGKYKDSPNEIRFENQSLT